MHELSDEERKLLRYYENDKRVVGGLQRSPIHQRLLRMSYIKEQSVNLSDLLIILTDAGREALSTKT
jgi:hypothetical protein